MCSLCEHIHVHVRGVGCGWEASLLIYVMGHEKKRYGSLGFIRKNLIVNTFWVNLIKFYTLLVGILDTLFCFYKIFSINSCK